jgi:hypothetical protein
MKLSKIISKTKKKKKNFNSFFFLRKFEKIVLEQVQKGFDGRTANSDTDWNYFGAVLYAVTLISTIGIN